MNFPLLVEHLRELPCICEELSKGTLEVRDKKHQLVPLASFKESALQILQTHEHFRTDPEHLWKGTVAVGDEAPVPVNIVRLEMERLVAEDGEVEVTLSGTPVKSADIISVTVSAPTPTPVVPPVIEEEVVAEEQPLVAVDEDLAIDAAVENVPAPEETATVTEEEDLVEEEDTEEPSPEEAPTAEGDKTPSANASARMSRKERRRRNR